ncbi:hypothetical protein CLV30_103153 [Haloactinopolyspora alba]|uniref:Uncharacterized protein n=1 Tax=Haloactinopolyspora alba TaxID=648780 RepID=A0A2P8E941_9ACTN|nr:hypothetical protein [Haloactinopolyspora alba]PSL05999.1 hypothetical protein CLV30_103153 [Haloactinopolyspora alba]
MSTAPRFGRRELLVAGAGLLSGACVAEGQRRGSTPSTPVTGDTPTSARSARALPSTAPTSGRPTPPALPEVRPWTPAAGEVEPGAKTAAARVVEALGSVSGDSTPAARLRAAGADPALAAAAGELVPPAAPAVTRIVYPQYGGLAGDAASVIVVAEQHWRVGDGLAGRSVTADVRLRRRAGGWAVTEVRPATGSDAAPAGRAARLVAHPRVELPDAAVADLAAGRVDPAVVDVLLELSADRRLSVSVLRSGHPANVFGTTRTSNHTRGRAVDVWAVDGVPIVGMPADDPALLGFLAAARDAGCDEIGGPVDPDGAGGVHFTDQVHRDHVHLGLES